MKRIIKIILILLAIFLLILGIIWLIGRHTAKEAGQTPLSFKQFLGLSTKTVPAQTAPGANPSNFGQTTTGNNGGNAGANGSGSTGTGAFNSGATQVSQFTNGGSSPVGNTGTNGVGIGNANNSGGSGTNSNATASSTAGTSGTANTAVAPSCGTADTTIAFTAEQIAELNALQNRFYALAQTLHTDADVATEVANHDAFALKADQVTELYNYCEAKLPLITDPRLQQHLATPFWRQWLTTDTPGNQWNTSGRQDQDTWSFIDFTAVDPVHLTQIHNSNTDNPDTSGVSGPYGLLNISNPQIVNVDGSSLGVDTQLLVPVVERILRINLW